MSTEPYWDTDISQGSRDWLAHLGYPYPTVHPVAKELKGCHDGDSEYLKSSDLREIAKAFVEAADWLDKRAQRWTDGGP